MTTPERTYVVCGAGGPGDVGPSPHAAAEAATVTVMAPSRPLIPVIRNIFASSRLPFTSVRRKALRKSATRAAATGAPPV
jgi:hypothetical protein